MKLLRLSLWFLAVVLPTAIGGCGGGLASSGDSGGSCTPAVSTTTTSSCPARTAVAGVAFSGKVLAGNQPVSDAVVQLYAAGNSGNGSAPTALFSTTLATGNDGSFAIPAGYSCPSAQTPVYLLAKGGRPGTASASNSALWLMTAIGPCGNVATGSSVTVNEVTTVAAAWALAPFLSGGGSLGASCTNTTGLDNAFATANNLVNTATGASPGAATPATLAVPTTKLNTLANALAACATGTSCSALFTAATTSGTAPANTLDAALNIARSPASNIAAVYSLASSNTVYSPALAAVPPDWMLSSTVSGGGMNLPTTIGVAESGNLWVASYYNTISVFSPGGSALFPSGITGNGINQSYGLALDPIGNVWIANEQTTMNAGSGTVTELSASGALLASGLNGGGINFPIAVAADPNGNIWFADYGDSKVTVLSSTGSALSSSSGWGGTSLAFPVALAIDANHNAWVANQGGLLPVTKISSDGATVTNYACDCNGASGVATDQKGNVWIANYYGNSISEVNTCGTLELDAASGGGITRPQGIAIDGAGTVWVANYKGNSISEIDGASSSTPGIFLSPSAGFGSDASLLLPYSLAIDSSGSIWVANSGKNTLTQFIGVAAPVKTPMAGPPQTP